MPYRTLITPAARAESATTWPAEPRRTRGAALPPKLPDHRCSDRRTGAAPGERHEAGRKCLRAVGDHCTDTSPGGAAPAASLERTETDPASPPRAATMHRPGRAQRLSSSPRRQLGRHAVPRSRRRGGPSSDDHEHALDGHRPATTRRFAAFAPRSLTPRPEARSARGRTATPGPADERVPRGSRTTTRRRRRSRCRRRRTGRTVAGAPSPAGCAALPRRDAQRQHVVVSIAATTSPAESASRIVGRKSTDITAGYSSGVLGDGRSICEPPASVPDSARSSNSPTASVVLVASEFGRRCSTARRGRTPSPPSAGRSSRCGPTDRGPAVGSAPAKRHCDGERGEHHDRDVGSNHVAEPAARDQADPPPAAAFEDPCCHGRRCRATASSPLPCRCSTARTAATGGRTRAARSGVGCPRAGR